MATTLALIFTLLQLLPLPQKLIGILAPGAYDVLTLSLGPNFGWARLSMDPPATNGELLKLVTYAAAAILGVVLYRRRLAWISTEGNQVNV